MATSESPYNSPEATVLGIAIGVAIGIAIVPRHARAPFEVVDSDSDTDSDPDQASTYAELP